MRGKRREGKEIGSEGTKTYKGKDNYQSIQATGTKTSSILNSTVGFSLQRKQLKTNGFTF